MDEIRATMDRILDDVFPSLQGRCRYSPREAPPPVLPTHATPTPITPSTNTQMTHCDAMHCTALRYTSPTTARSY